MSYRVHIIEGHHIGRVYTAPHLLGRGFTFGIEQSEEWEKTGELPDFDAPVPEKITVSHYRAYPIYLHPIDGVPDFWVGVKSDRSEAEAQDIIKEYLNAHKN